MYHMAAAPATEQSASCHHYGSAARDTVWHVSCGVTLDLSRREETEHIQRRLSPSQTQHTESFLKQEQLACEYI